jgi:RNA polymerase primary sigma factor
VARVIGALAADWERQEGVLKRAQVERLILKRRLSGEEAVAVFQGLARNGIVLKTETDATPSRTLATEDESRGEGRQEPTDDFVPGYFSGQLLSHREEIELGRSIQLGFLARADLASGVESRDLHHFVAQGERARSRLVESNLRLVVSVAQRLVGRCSLELADLVQEGTIGLMRAAELFDPDLGLKFSTYATHWIHQSISRSADNLLGIIRLPVHRLESIRKLRHAKRLLTSEFGHQPSARELAEALDWSPEKVAYIQFLSQMRVVSLDLPVEGDDATTVGDTIHSSMSSPEQLCVQAELRHSVHGLLKSLDSRQRTIVVRRFGLADGREETLQRIGDDLEITRERVRQLEARALKLLMRRAKSVPAADFLGIAGTR